MASWLNDLQSLFNNSSQGKHSLSLSQISTIMRRRQSADIKRILDMETRYHIYSLCKFTKIEKLWIINIFNFSKINLEFASCKSLSNWLVNLVESLHLLCNNFYCREELVNLPPFKNRIEMKVKINS